MKRFWSIRSHLLALVLVVIIPCAGLLAYLIYSGVSKGNQAARENVISLARLTAASTASEITECQRVINRYANRWSVKSMDPNQRPNFFTNFARLQPQFQNLLLINSQKRIVHSIAPLPTNAPVVLTDTNWFQQQVMQGLQCVTPLTLDPVTGQRTVFLASPVVDELGEFMGGLCGALDLSRFNVNLANLTLPAGSLVLIVDRLGAVLGRSDSPRPTPGEDIRKYTLGPSSFEDHEGALTVTGTDGVRRLVGYAAVRPSGWHVCVLMPTNLIAHEQKANAARSALLALIIGTLTTCLALILSRRINRPIHGLADGIAATASSQLEGNVPVDGPREIAEVAREFNALIAARRADEERLRHSEERYRTLFEQAFYGVLVADRSGCLLDVNPFLCQMFGYTREEVIGRPILQFLAPEHVDMTREGLSNLVPGDTVYRERRCRRKDGTIFTAEISGRQLPDGRLIAIMRDISERKHAEEALRHSEEQYRLLATTSTDMISRHTADGFVTYVSPACRALLDYTEAELLGQRASDWVHPDDVDRVWNAIRTEGVDTGSYRVELRMKTKTGYVWVETVGRLVRDAKSGAVREILCFTRDISERKNFEEALQKSEAKYRTLFEQAFIGILITDPQGQVLEVNQHGHNLFGYTRQEMLGRMVHELVDPAERAAQADAFAEANAGKTVNIQSRGRQKHGTIFFAEVSLKSLPDGNLLGIIRDISDRKRAETALMRVNRALRVLSEVNQHIFRAVDEQDMLDRITRLIVEDGGYRMAWVGRAEHDEQKSVRPLAQAGFELGYLQTLNLSWGNNEYGRGPGGTAIRNGKPVIVQNIVSDPSFAPWRLEAAKRSYSSTISLPLVVEGQTFGMLAIYSMEVGAFDTEEAKLLSDLAVDLSFGIQSLRAAKAKHQAEEALRRSEANYRTLIEQSVDGIFLVSPEGRFLDANTAGCQISGYAREELVGLRVTQVITSEDLPEMSTSMAEVLAGQTVQNEWRCRRKDGSIFIGELRTRRLPDGRILSIVRNVTERRQAEAERARLAAILEATSDFVIVAASDRTPLYLNRAGRRALGIPDDEKLQHSRIADYFPAWAMDLLEREALPAAIRDGVWSGEIAWRSRSGREIPVLQVMLAHKAADGTLQFISSTARDITDLKKAESALRDVSGRLLRLQEEEQRRIARELHDTTGQNLAALSMNLRRLQATLLPTNPPVVKILEDALMLTAQSIQEVRTLSYLLHPPVLDQLGLARALEEYAVGFQSRSGIAIELDLARDLGKSSRELEMTLFRVAQESLVNIHRHSGSPTAALRLWRDGDECWLEIADQGHGIPEDKLQELQTGGFQLGVGIAGMRERVRQLGGRLAIHSGPRGTTVQAIVPMGKEIPVSEWEL